MLFSDFFMVIFYRYIDTISETIVISVTFVTDISYFPSFLVVNSIVIHEC